MATIGQNYQCLIENSLFLNELHYMHLGIVNCQHNYIIYKFTNQLLAWKQHKKNSYVRGVTPIPKKKHAKKCKQFSVQHIS